MILHLFVYGLLIRVVGSETSMCNLDFVDANHLVEKINKCNDLLFEACTKAADDVKHMFDAEKTVKAQKCEDLAIDIDLSNNQLAFLTIMERYDYSVEYYEDLPNYGHNYIGFLARKFVAENDYKKFMPMICPNYTMKACRALLAFCDHKDYAVLDFCAHSSYTPYKEYLQCYHTPSESTIDCAMLCDKVVTKKLFGIEKTDDVNCKIGRERCENIEKVGLISECEGYFKSKCDVSDPNTYSQCEDAIRNMKVTPQALATALEKHRCKDTNSRLICFQYLKLLGEGKMSAQFIESHCSKNSKPQICNTMEEYCGNSKLKLPDDAPECKKQTEAITTSTLAPRKQSYQITAALTIVTTQNQKVKHKISCILLISLLLFV